MNVKHAGSVFVATCAASILLQAATWTQSNSDWEKISQNSKISTLPTETIGDYEIAFLEYTNPDKPDSNVCNGYQILQSDKLVYAEMADTPEQFTTWYKLAPTFDLDDDGTSEIAICTTKSDGTSELRVFSIGKELALKGSLSDQKCSFNYVTTDSGTGKELNKITAEPTTDDSPASGIIALTPDGLVIEKSARSVEELGLLGHAVLCVKSWRDGAAWGDSSAASKYWLAQCNVILEKKKDDADLLALRGALYSVQYPIAMNEAEADAKAAINLSSDNALAHAVLGHITDIRQKYTDAADEFTKAIKAQPKNPEWLANRALAYEGAEQFDKAIEDYGAMIALVPTNDWAYASRAHAYLGMNKGAPSASDLEKAVADIDKTLELNPKNVFAYKQRADANIKQKNDKEAIQYLEKAEALLSAGDPELVEIYDMKARCYAVIGDQKNAKEYFDKCKKLSDEINSAANSSNSSQ